jgi:lipopolysaccharide biosynthesis regulator YciM
MADWLPWLFVGALACFGLGWLAARTDLKQLLHESRAMPSAYFRGLNFLMNEEPDKAIDSFIEVSRAHPEVVELQFALGGLFRRRGEADRAIRIHQDLIERSGSDETLRASAMLELARDYQKAGLSEHAEKTLDELLARGRADDPLKKDALILQKDVCVQARDWPRAIEAARELEGRFMPADAALKRERAQFHCERAEDLVGTDADAAMQQLNEAINANPQCVRAILLRGDWLAKGGDAQGAIAVWQTIATTDKRQLGLAGERVLAAYRSLERLPEAITLLTQWQAMAPSLEIVRVLMDAIRDTEGEAAAEALASRALQEQPTLVGLDRVLAMRAAVQANPQTGTASGGDIALHRTVVHAHAEKLAVYLCAGCGFKSRQYFWHCPACGGWETFPPHLTAEQDDAVRHLFHEHAQSAAKSTT